MAKGSTDRDIHPAPQGEPVTFYLPRDPGMDPSRPYAMTVSINGHKYPVQFGKWNTHPKEVADYMASLGKDGTKVPDLKKYDSDQGGVARPDSDFGNPTMKDEPNPGRYQIEYR